MYGDKNMGINAINCKGLYAETGKSKFGEGSRSASDFDVRDIIADNIGPIIVAFVCGLIGVDLLDKFRKSQIIQLAYGDEIFGFGLDDGIDAQLNAKKVGDSVDFHSHQTKADYTAMFEGFKEGKALFNVTRRDVSGSVENRSIALADYTMPGTQEDALRLYQKILDGSTDTVASINFDGNEKFPALKVLAYADIKHGEAELKIAEGYLESPIFDGPPIVSV